MNQKQTPVLLLTGYLGSGKTTLVNRILSNRQGIRFAVIVNDIGEVNIDASLIQQGGVVKQQDDSLVALQNGCICCTLKMDLVNQLRDLIKAGTFDYIVIEASGICEPVPIAQTICSIAGMPPEYTKYGIPRLDCIVSVVDALRLRDEFACAKDLTRDNIDDEDIENLIIQQIEFCDIILLNKVDQVTEEELRQIKAVVRAIQPTAKVVECTYADVPLQQILNTNSFNFDKASLSAAWIKELGKPVEDEEESEEEEEYGIGTFVYYRRRPFDINKFDRFVIKYWPENVIRTKGICWFDDNNDMSYLFEQSGRQKQLKEIGQWYATAPAEELEELMMEDPTLAMDWDDECGDRMIKLVFIGQHLDRAKLTDELDFCLA
ncbi:MAG: GTP-binding protein [Bacteroidales bacterium]|nr:GTP-binding protein [Bacteroidales bacterium]